MSAATKARIGWVAAVIVAAALGAWAGRATFAPPATTAADAAPALYTVTEDTVGRVQSFPVTATWGATPLLTGIARGTITSIAVTAGDEVGPGDTLYTVDLRPTILAHGAVPAFRDMAQDTSGDDVRQLQQFLADADYLDDDAVTGMFDGATTTAVRAWQKAAGYPVDGIVHLGDLAFTDPLPTRVLLADDVTVGLPAPTATAVASTLGDAPTFTIRLDISQQDLVPSSGPVSVTTADGTEWDGVISGATVTNSGDYILTLGAADGGPICGTDCGSVPVATGSAVYTAKITVVAPATGPAVPASAIEVDASGNTVVQTADGTRVPVTIRSQARGMAVVDGIDAGIQVRLVADDAAAGRPAAAPPADPPAEPATTETTPK